MMGEVRLRIGDLKATCEDWPSQNIVSARFRRRQQYDRTLWRLSGKMCHFAIDLDISHAIYIHDPIRPPSCFRFV